MLNVALRGLLAHKLRLLMTALSIAIGVAFTAGTLILTDSLNSSFRQAFTDQYAGVDVVVRDRQPVPASLLARVESVPGVADAEGSVSGFAMMVDTSGRAIGAGGLSTTGMSTHVNSGLAAAVHYAEGRAPTGRGHVAIDAKTAEHHHIAVGDRMRVLFAGPPGEFTVVGVVRFGDSDSLGAGTTALFDTASAQHFLGRDNSYDAIHVEAAGGVDPAVLRDRVSAVLPAGTEAVTGSAVADEGAQAVRDGLKSFNTFLLAFAGIAVFVGSFIIWNTFSILVAQRSREIALLRALGATRRQVMRSVLTEALAVGVVASLVGLAGGVVLAGGLTLLLETVGLELPAIGTTMTPRTVVVSVVVGTVVTLVASVVPARAATRVAPVEALRDATPGLNRFSRRRAIASAAVTGVGVAALAAGLFGGAGILSVGIGVAVTFLGVTALLPLLARPVAGLVGLPLRRFGGMAGRLARDNAARNPKRTASTAAALMIGLGLVASVTVLASSLKASVDSDVDRTLRADFIVDLAGGQGAGISPAAADAIKGRAAVTAVSEVADGTVKINGVETDVAAVDPATVGQVLDLGIAGGDLRALDDGGVFVYDQTARSKGWTVGREISVEWPETGAHPLKLAGTFTEKGAFDSDYMISLATYDENVAQRLDWYILVDAAPGSSLTQAQDAVIAATRDYPNAVVLTAEEFVDSVSGQIDKVLLFITALLLLAVLIALLGIVNTLALSVFERTRELGLLRAVGMSRRQVRSMVRSESVVIAVFGALMGALVGIGFGVALTAALKDDGFGTLDVPAAQLAGYIALAAVAGVLAAILPARRAAGVDLLRAVVHD
jgi:putative ABC transport system permease protein